MTPMPVVTLSNGIRIANFSSPHPFIFEDGTILDGCTSDRVELGQLPVTEFESPGIKGTTDVLIDFNLNAECRYMIDLANKQEDVDIILIPFPLMQTLKAIGIKPAKLRVIRTKDRTTKEICIDRFCI